MAIYPRSRGAHQNRQDRARHGAQCKCRRPRCGKIARSHTAPTSRRLAFPCVIRCFFELGALELHLPFENLAVVKPQGVVEIDVRLNWRRPPPRAATRRAPGFPAEPQRAPRASAPRSVSPAPRRGGRVAQKAKQAMQTAGGRPPTGARCSTSRSAAGCSCRYRSQGPPIRHLKIASVIVREFDGKMHEVVVAPGGFYWSGQTYASQSAIARKVTGTSWNGPRFFGLRGTSEPAQAELEVKPKGVGKDPRSGRSRAYLDRISKQSSSRPLGRRSPIEKLTRRPAQRRKSPQARNAWLGREDSNLRMAESKSAALPLGDAPSFAGVAPARAIPIRRLALLRNMLVASFRDAARRH